MGFGLRAGLKCLIRKRQEIIIFRDELMSPTPPSDSHIQTFESHAKLNMVKLRCDFPFERAPDCRES